MATLFTHIKTLVNTREKVELLRGTALKDLPTIDDAYLVVEGAHIAAFGPMAELKWKPKAFAFHVEASGKLVLPAWCDSHTHLVFAGSREDEMVDKIQGLSYAEIAARGGGIQATAKKVAEASEDQLYNLAFARLHELMQLGTGAIEIKSGYGLSVENEIKMLRVIRRLQQTAPIPVRSTFLGAHAIPQAYKENRLGYIDAIINQMLPLIEKEALADYIDVFCEQGFFTPQETILICEEGKRRGLKPKIHANQLAVSGGVQAGISVGAVSVDHLESMDSAAIKALASSSTIGTILPTAAFYLRMPYAPARQLIQAGCALALASDYNPGSSPSGNMNFVVALACIGMKLLPQEAINAATTNGAFAMELQDKVGSIAVGKLANLILTKPLPSINFLPYAFGSNLIERVMLAGAWV